jgi:hypothetical protein
MPQLEPKYNLRATTPSGNTPQVTHRGPLVTYHEKMNWNLNPQATVSYKPRPHTSQREL